MAGKIKARLEKIDAKEKSRRIIKEFKEYLNKYSELELEFSRIPRWRHFKQMKNIRQRERLTRQFKVRMFELGVLV